MNEKEMPDDVCTEPDGNHPVDNVPAHTLMLIETGQCPWCGEVR